MSQPAVSVKKLHKAFKLPQERRSSLKQAALQWNRRKFERQKVLDGVSFDIAPGEFFGIVGRNGSGKSTLLKLLAGIYTPTSGELKVNGLLTPFIELGVGFNPELTGRDNVYLNGAIFGLTKKHVDQLYDQIVSFAELERFMDQKLKNYSSGMQVRLAFSIAIRAQNDILLIDEVLAVGDEAFQRKCFNYFKEIKNSGRTVIFVSHDMEAVRDFCTRAMLIHEGKVKVIGHPIEVTNAYSQINMETTVKNLEQMNARGQRSGTGEARILTVRTINRQLAKKNSYAPEEDVWIEIEAEALGELEAPSVGLVIEDSERRPIFATNTGIIGHKIKDLKTGQRVKAIFKVENIFTDGEYSISCAVSTGDRRTAFDRLEQAHRFHISGWVMKHSFTHPKHSVEIKVS